MLLHCPKVNNVLPIFIFTSNIGDIQPGFVLNHCRRLYVKSLIYILET
jgi:hypothetical protein